MSGTEARTIDGTELRAANAERRLSKAEAEIERLRGVLARLTSEECLEAAAIAAHETYEKRAPEFGYVTRPDTAVPWEQLMPENQQLMLAANAAGLQAALDKARGPHEGL